MRLATLGAVKLPNYSIRLMARMLEELGLDVRAAARAAGLPPQNLSDPMETVTGLQEIAFQRAFMQATADRPQLWVELGSRYRLLSQGHSVYGLMMSTAETVQTALEVGQHMGDLYYMLAQGQAMYCRGIISGFRSFSTELPPDLHRFSALRDVGVNYAVLSDLWGGDFPFSHIELPLDKSDEPYIRRLLPNADLVFGSGHNSWSWQEDLTTKRPPHSDPILHEYYRRACEMVVGQARGAEDILARLSQLLTLSLQPPDIERAARGIGLSVRSLQRQLAARGLNYRQLISLNRHESACRLLSDSKAPISRIAFQVGYENVSSFNISFRRHAGMSPGQYRRGTGSAPN